MLILHLTSSRFCLYLLNYYHFTYTFSHAHTEAHTHRHTCTISTQQEWRQPGTGAWLREAEEGLCERPCTQTQKHKKKSETKPIFTNLKEKVRAHRASSKLLDYFLRSNKITSIKPILSRARFSQSRPMVCPYFTCSQASSPSPAHRL